MDKIHQLATLEMREQIEHECRNKVGDLRTCSGKDTCKRKPSLQAIDAQLLDASDEMWTYSIAHDLEFLHCSKRHQDCLSYISEDMKWGEYEVIWNRGWVFGETFGYISQSHDDMMNFDDG